MAPTALGRVRILTAVMVFLLLPRNSPAQSCLGCSEVVAATTADHVALLSANALIGGVTAGLVRLAQGDPLKRVFNDAFLKGAAGGGLLYAGKRMAASDFNGAGFLGRELAAIGASITSNAGDGIGTFDRLIIPLGPVPIRLQLERQGTRMCLHPLFDLASGLALVYGIAANRYSFDWGSSISAGAAVFRERNPYVNWPEPPPLPDSDQLIGATTFGGTIFTSYLAPGEAILAHERVHTLQFDFVVTTVGDRADSWTLARVPSLDRWIKLNLVPAAFGLFNQTLKNFADTRRLPWEREASLLSGNG